MPTPREASIWGKIRTDLNEAQQNILNGRYAEAMVLDREILKRIVRMQVDKAVLVSNNLESDIEQLFENRLISKETRDQYHAIRLYAEQTENGVQATAQAANDSFSLLKDALEHYVDSNAQRSSGGGYETRSFQGSSRFSSGYSGPAAGERSFAAAGSDSYASTDAADSVSSSYEADGSDDADTVRRYTAPENEGEYDTAAGSGDVDAGAATAPRSSFDASGVDLPLGNAPRRSGSNVHHRSSRNTNQRPTRPLRDSERVSRNGNRRPAATSTAKRAAASGRRNANRPRGGQKGRKQELDLYGTIDACVCCLDSINYVTDTEVLREACRRVQLFLMPGAPFIFDINTREKLERIDGQSFVREDEDIFCVWQTRIDEDDLCHYDFDFFELNEEGAWNRYQEHHAERIYSVETLVQLLKDTGFEHIEVRGELSDNPPEEGEERIFLIANANLEEKHDRRK